MGGLVPPIDGDLQADSRAITTVGESGRVGQIATSGPCGSRAVGPSSRM